MADLLQDQRSIGGSDGVYPVSIKDSDDTAVANPMELKLEHSGLVDTLPRSATNYWRTRLFSDSSVPEA